MTGFIKSLAVQPKALYILFITELWERFSYTGLRVLLIFYIISELKQSDDVAYGIYGMYFTLIYASTIVGGYLADRYLGNLKAIYLGAYIIAAGHISLASLPNDFLPLGLSFIIVGTGFFKVNISSLLGHYYHLNDPRRDAGFTIFYMGINIGGLLAPLICGYIGRQYGWHYGFGTAGLGILFSILSLYVGKNLLGEGKRGSYQYNLHQPALLKLSPYQWIIIGSLFSIPLFSWCIQNHNSIEPFLKLLSLVSLTVLVKTVIDCKKEERKALLALIAMLPFYMAFWISFEQTGGSINLFTDRYVRRCFFNYEIDPIWFQSLNPFFIIILTPILSNLWFSLARKNKEPLTPTKFSLALFQIGLSFLLLKLGVEEASKSGTASMFWIVSAYFLHASGELFLSPIGLSMVTKLAPARFVSLMMGFLFLSMAFAQFIAQKIAHYFTTAQTINHLTKTATLFDFGNIFEFLIYLPIISGVLLICILPFLKRIFIKYT